MADLLRIDSSARGEDSVSRALTGRAAARRSDRHPDGRIVRRDLGDHPLPHLTNATGVARMVDSDTHTDAQAHSYQLTRDLIDEVRTAGTIVIGMPLYNYGPPSSLKPWVDLLVGRGLSSDPVTRIGSLSGLQVNDCRGRAVGQGRPLGRL